MDKSAIRRCRIREVLRAARPGHAERFCHPWDDSPAPPPRARHTTAAQAARQAGTAGWQRPAAKRHRRCRPGTSHKRRARAAPAPPDQGHAPQRRRLVSRDGDRLDNTRQLLARERDRAPRVVGTPDVLLPAIPGISVVTVADLAGELGPSASYANADALTGRAGLLPSRYPSARVDGADGPRRRRGHRRRRAVLTPTADNLAQGSHHFRARAAQRRRAGKGPRGRRVKVAKSFSRLASAVVAGRHWFPRACCQPRPSWRGQLPAFHGDHGTDRGGQLRDLRAGVEQRPAPSCPAEAGAPREQLDALPGRRRPPPLGPPPGGAGTAGGPGATTGAPGARGGRAGRRGLGVQQRLVVALGLPGLPEPWRWVGSPRRMRPVGVRL